MIGYLDVNNYALTPIKAYVSSISFITPAMTIEGNRGEKGRHQKLAEAST
jgi:hypothetical protein